MISVRRSEDRGHADYGWLDTYHTFSFNDYYDPKYMGFRALRVINEDRVAPEAGFPTHAHRDMEILTYVIDGALEHKDSMGHGEVIRPGEIQRMSAGRGVTHSEFNASRTDPVHLLQIWIQPASRGAEPGYQQIRVGGDATSERLQLIASREGGPGAVSMNQDALVYRGLLPAESRLSHPLDPKRYGYLQLISGTIEAAGETLHAGDGAALSESASVELVAREDAEFLFFDLA